MSGIDVGDTLVNRYHIEKELGRGGFGCTYLAHDATINRKVVVKELLEKWTRHKAIVQRFINEAVAMGGLNHPNIVTVYDLLRPEAYPRQLRQYYIIEEFMRGGSVEVRARKGLTWEQATQITIGVCEGLAAAHAKNIVHRDIKPANILTSEDFREIKIVDFGIAHLPDQDLTAGGMHPGTLLFMAPESFQRDAEDPITGSVDQYAVGVTLYSLLTGVDYLDFGECLEHAEREIRRRYRLRDDLDMTLQQQLEYQMLAQQNWMETVKRVMPPPPSSHNADLPPELNNIVMRALAKNPGERYPSTSVMAEEIRKIRPAGRSSDRARVVTATTWQINDIIARTLAAVQQGQMSTALELIQHALSIAPENVRTLATLASIQMQRSEFADAVRAWLKVMEIDPAYPELYVKLGRCYNALREPMKAIEIQVRGLQRPENSTNEALYRSLANSYKEAGNLRLAIATLEQALAIRPDPRISALLNQWKKQL